MADTTSKRFLRRGRGFAPFRRRIVFYLCTAWVAITLNFLLPRLMPGDPAQAVISELAQRHPITPAQMQEVENLFGAPHESLWTQYIGYLNQLAHGDFGLSIAFYPTPVMQVIGTGIWWTLILVGVTTVLAFVIGTGIGIVAGWRPGSRTDSVLSPLSVLFGSLPFFWVAMLAALVFGEHLRWFPYERGYDAGVQIGFTWQFLSTAIPHAVLPAVTIIVSSVGGWVFGMRNMMVTTVCDDYVVLATAKGLRRSRIMFTYAARNAILPSVSGFAMALGFVVGGSLLAEIVFAYPGIGYLMFDAVSNDDYPLMQALFLIISLSVLAANFVADSVYVLLDPRTSEVSS
jgi:peptide/nickel transport system permease protein